MAGTLFPKLSHIQRPWPSLLDKPFGDGYVARTVLRMRINTFLPFEFSNLHLLSFKNISENVRYCKISWCISLTHRL